MLMLLTIVPAVVVVGITDGIIIIPDGIIIITDGTIKIMDGIRTKDGMAGTKTGDVVTIGDATDGTGDMEIIGNSLLMDTMIIIIMAIMDSETLIS